MTMRSIIVLCQVLAAIKGRLYGSLAPVVTRLGRDVAGRPKVASFLNRLIHDGLVERGTVRQSHDVLASDADHYGEPVQHSEPKLSVNQMLEARGYLPVRHIMDPSLRVRLEARIAAIQARRSSARESGASS